MGVYLIPEQKSGFQPRCWCRATILLLAATPWLLSCSGLYGQVVINEILYDPYEVGLEGDANNDKVSHIFNDEFVEIVNTTVDPVDITDWILRQDRKSVG